MATVLPELVAIEPIPGGIDTVGCSGASDEPPALKKLGAPPPPRGDGDGDAPGAVGGVALTTLKRVAPPELAVT